ncbi:hypothetical protein Hanom_Chr15g01403421 [Helianthus anomalus]
MFLQVKASDWDKSHNIYCLLDVVYIDNTIFSDIAKFLRESKIAKALTGKTIIYESHVRRFWSSARYEDKEKTIYSAVRKKDENGQDIDLEIKFNVSDLRRVLELGDRWGSLGTFFERQIWITDGPLEFHRATSGTTRSYLSPLGIIPIHQFRKKTNKYGKTPLWKSNPRPIGPKALSKNGKNNVLPFLQVHDSLCSTCIIT